MTQPLSIGEPSKKEKARIPAKMVRGVENPATVLLAPADFDTKRVSWWSQDRVLLCGLLLKAVKNSKSPLETDSIRFLPTPIPRSWNGRHLTIIVEYECKHEGTFFALKAHYGCHVSNKIHNVETPMMQGTAGDKARASFEVKSRVIQQNSLFQMSLEVVRASPKPILIRGTWLEATV